MDNKHFVNRQSKDLEISLGTSLVHIIFGSMWCANFAHATVNYAHLRAHVIVPAQRRQIASSE